MLTKFATNAFLERLDQSTGIKLTLSDLKSDMRIKISTDDTVKRYLEKNDASWTDEINLVKNSNNRNLAVSEILQVFKSLRLVNLSIKEIDSNFNCFNNLVELNLSGNVLKTVDNIPSSVEILDLNANKLDKMPDLKSLANLKHLGVSFNQITEISIESLPSSLISLDLSNNLLYDLKSLQESLKSLKCLRNLTLIGNPVSLCLAYDKYLISKLPLMILDDKTVSKCSQYQLEDAFKVYLKCHIQCMTGIKAPEFIPTFPDQPRDEFKYSVKCEFESYPDLVCQSEFIPWNSEIIEFNFTSTLTIGISSDISTILKNGPIVSLLLGKSVFVVDSTPSNGKKGTKKEATNWIPSPMEIRLLESQKLSIASISRENEIILDYVMSDGVLRVCWRISTS